MKLGTKKLLSGILASSMALALALPAQASATVQGADYYNFYQTYGEGNDATVFYNGQEIAFTEAYPLIIDGVTYVPLAMFSDVIGSEIRYIQATHSVALDYQGNSITFNIGETGFSVNGGAEQHLATATFVANDRTMVPLRFITAAFDLNVYWNNSYRQVVVADMDSLKEEIVLDYTLMNSLLGLTNSKEAGKNLSLDGDFKYVLSEQGNDMIMEGELGLLANEDGSALNYDLSLSVDLTDYSQLIQEILAGMEEGAEQETMNNLVASLEQVDVSLIYDLENFDFYLQSGLVGDLVSLYLEAPGIRLPESTWYKLPLSDFMVDSELSSLKAMMSEAVKMEAVNTMEGLVDTMMAMTSYYDNRYVNVYGGLELLLDSSKDENFTQDEGRYTTQGSMKQNGETVAYSLMLSTNESGKVTGYELTFRQGEGTDQWMVMTITQPHEEKVLFAMDMGLMGLEMDFSGEFDLLHTYEEAVKVPSGTVVDLGDVE